MAKNSDFAGALLAWFDVHGRHDLPWQRDPTAYHVWVSEIMLQQTQVATVIPYYARFMARFPDVAALAAAPLDEVLHHWSGLGYYARARNLKRAAERIAAAHAGALPGTLEALAALPGIGRSTAGAILSLAFGQRVPILDGNVKRVLTRHRGLAGWVGNAAVQRALWTLADALMPAARPGDYTQAIMDLGATLCVRRNPECGRCPVAAACVARIESRQHEIPAPRPKRAVPVKHTRFLVAERPDGALLLERRPPAGIWGGLWSFPEFENDTAASLAKLGLGAALVTRELAPISHTFTHFRLEIAPVHVSVDGTSATLMDSADRVWYKVTTPVAIGLAAPVARLIESLRDATQRRGTKVTSA
ncbi:MAG: A/G-specific adenine glycosylase [Gammaproteobacteria bacterium]|nr:A/G-specific adenine glycosylase [Gammaproteobacteria bacterium]